jgi:hypothetical protein
MNWEIIIFIVVFGIFLYFGYKDDYKRDKNSFTKTIAFILGMFVYILLWSFLILKFKIDTRSFYYGHISYFIIVKLGNWGEKNLDKKFPKKVL